MKQRFQRFIFVLAAGLALGMTAGCTKHFRASRLLNQANRAFAEERYDDAELDYKNVRHLDTLNPVAIGQLGRIYVKEGRMMQAYPYLQEAADKLDPDNMAVQLAFGQALATFHEETNAIARALRVLAAEPTNAEAIELLADVTLSPVQLRKYIGSIPAVESNPGYPIAMAIAALREKKYDQAEGLLRQAIAADPKSGQAYFILAEIAIARGNAKEMAKNFQIAASLAPVRSSIRSRYVDYLTQTGSAEEARKLAVEITEKAPDYIPGWVSLMNLNLSERKYADAAEDAGNILSRDDRNYDGLLGMGNISLAKGEGAQAVAQFERMNSFALYRKSPQLKYELARAYLLTRDRAKAMDYLNQALALDPAYAPATLLMGQLLIRSDPDSAVALLTRYIKKVPGDGQAELLLADAYLAEQKISAALAVYDHLAENLPKNPQIPMLIGMTLAREGKISQARAALQKSLKLAPDYALALEQLINLELAQNNFKAAEALVEDQIHRNPKAAEPWEFQAKIDVARTNMDQAEKDLRRAIELNPNLPNPYLLLARVYFRSKKYGDALKNLQNLVSHTNDAPAYMQIGAIHEVLQDFGAARDAYEKVLSMNPNSPPALNNLAYIDAVHLHDLDEAYTLAEKARDLFPYNPNVSDTLGWIVFQRGDYPRALSLLEDSEERDPNDPEIQFHLGMAHYMLDEEDMARVSLQRAATSKQQFPNKDEAIKCLATLNIDPARATAADLTALEKGLKDRPNDPVILNRIGSIEEHQGQWQKAADTFEAALKQNPGVVSIMAKLARLYAVRLNQPDKAMSVATAAHKIAPDNAFVSAILGHLVFRTGDYQWALSLLENAESRVNDPELLYDLAWAYYSVGRSADAEKTMQRAVQNPGMIHGESAKQFVAMLDAVKQTTVSPVALNQARTALQADPNNVPALMVSGWAAETAGDFKSARQFYEQAIAVFPLFAPAQRQLAILYSKYFPNEAAGYLLAEKARTAYPDDPFVARSLGMLAYFQGKYSRSAEVLQDSVNRGSTDGQVYYYLGRDLLELKRKRDAKAALQHAVASQLPANLAAEARRILEGLK